MDLHSHHFHKLLKEEIFIGRDKEINKIDMILQRSIKNNVLIIGKGGVGKTTLAIQIKKLIKNINIINPTNSLEDLKKFLNLNKNQIFILDEIFTFEPEKIKYIIDNAQIIGTANDIAYKKFSLDYPHLISKFEVISLEEPSIEEMKAIINLHQKKLSEKFLINFQQSLTDEIINLAKRYIIDEVFPSKGILLLEEVVFMAQNQKTTLVTVDMVKVAISQKTGIPITSLTEFEKKDLSSLPFRLKEKVKGQDHAIEKISQTIQKSRLGLGKKNKPIGSFLFVGPSGVGKTELAKVIAKEVFGDEESMIRFDMSEFSEAHTVQRLIGAPPGYIGYEEGGQLTNQIKNKPYTLVLLDEIEKAHPRIFDIFLQILDDGRLTDGQGKKVDFTNTIIIATSNAGIEDILDMINEGKKQDEIEKEIKEILEDYFRIEFINRFDDIIIFNSLDVKTLEEIAKIQLKKLSIELSKHNIELLIREETIKYLAKESYDPKYGARGLLRLIQDKIENKLASMIIESKLKGGEKVEF